MSITDEDEEALEDSGEYLFAPKGCRYFKVHLTLCDDDGYCKFCGEQDDQE